MSNSYDCYMACERGTLITTCTRSTLDTTKLQERPCIKSQAAAVVVTRGRVIARPISAHDHTQQCLKRNGGGEGGRGGKALT